jgi:hypothetical protein
LRDKTDFFNFSKNKKRISYFWQKKNDCCLFLLSSKV